MADEVFNIAKGRVVEYYNRVEGNEILGNAGDPPGPPFGGFAADVTLLTFGDNGNCYEGNLFDTYVSTLGVLPPCP